MNRGWHLGFVYNSDGKLINHRSLLKVLLNPFLRPLKHSIASNINYDDMTVTYCFIECEYVSLKDGIKEMRYTLYDGFSVIKKSTII